MAILGAINPVPDCRTRRRQYLAPGRLCEARGGPMLAPKRILTEKTPQSR